jgi:hypothetical protein
MNLSTQNEMPAIPQGSDLWTLKGVEFWEIRGVVLSSEKRSESQVHGFGGGGGIGTDANGCIYGSIDPVAINTTVSRSQEFWLRDESGREIHFELGDWSVPLRPDQTVSVLCAQRKHRWCVAGIHNHTAHTHHSTPSALELFAPTPRFIPWIDGERAIAVVTSLFLALMLLTGPHWMVVEGMVFGPWLAGWLILSQRRRSFRNALHSRAQTLMEFAAG